MKVIPRRDVLWYAVLVLGACVLGLLVRGPEWYQTRDARYQGVSVHLNADEAAYLPRVEEALLGRGEHMGTAITGGERLPSLQSGLLEMAYGAMFRPLHVSAAEALNFLDFIEPFLLFLVLVWFFRNLGLSRGRAFLAAALFAFLELYNLNRPVHQRGSFLLTILAIVLIMEGLERRALFGFFGGALMGILVGVYFWAWTTAWAWWGILLLMEMVAAYAASRAEPSFRSQIILWIRRVWDFLRRKAPAPAANRMQLLLLFGGIGGMTASPFLYEIFLSSLHPFYSDALFRSGIAYTRIPQSWPWSALFLFMAVGVTLLPVDSGGSHAWRYLLVTVSAAFLLLNQHVLHGVLFLFASHYLFFLVSAAVALLVISQAHAWRGALAFLSSAVFLAGIAYDNRAVLLQWQRDEEDFSEQHLSAALPELQTIPRSVVLTDPRTSAFVAGFTGHDVIFTAYVQHELRSNDELAERYCLTQVPLPLHRREPEREPVLIYGDGYDGFTTAEAKASAHVEELSRVLSMCRRVDARSRQILEKYDVRYVLWDQKRQPDWDLRHLNIRLAEVSRGEGWSLWKVL